MNIKFGSLKMQSPYIAASGCYGYGFEAQESIKTNIPLNWGAVTSKTITINPREGNPTPRIFETPSGVMNRIGLQNCGLDIFIKEKLPRLKKLPYQAIVSIFGENLSHWLKLTRTLSAEAVDAIELNPSCPNLEGEVLTGNRKKCAEIVEKVKKESSVPVWVKINAIDKPIEYASVFKEIGVDAIVCSNTIPSSALLKGKIYSGGLSGPAIKPIALRAVRNICSQTDIEIAACGGISSYKDIEDYKLCGARAFVLGTILLKRPDMVNIISKPDNEECGCDI